MEEPKKMTREEEADEIVRRLQKTKIEIDAEERKKALQELMRSLEEEMSIKVANEIDSEVYRKFIEAAEKTRRI